MAETKPATPSTPDRPPNTGPNVNPIKIPPTTDTKYIQGIVLAPGYDSETGVWGYGYSSDNGLHFYVTDTMFGRKYRQEDGDRVWPFISDKVKEALDGRVVTWSSVQGVPNFALKSDLPSLAGYAKLTDLPSLTDYAKKSDLPSMAGLVKETELADYAKKSDLPSTEGLAKETELADYVKKTDIQQTLAWGQVTGKPSLATSADVDDLREQIAKAGQAGDAGLSIESIAELVKSRVHAALDPASGHLAITVDDASSDTIAEAVAAKVAGSLSFAMDSNGDLIASVGR